MSNDTYNFHGQTTSAPHSSGGVNVYMGDNARSTATSSSSVPASFSTPAEPKKLVVICVKRHEFDALSRVLREAVEQGTHGLHVRDGNMFPQEQTHNEAGYSYRAFKLDRPVVVDVVLITFGELQGPVVAAARTAQVIAFEKPLYVGMVGICGGRKLGEVVLATRAFEPEGGHVEKNTDTIGGAIPVYKPARSSGDYKYVCKKDGAWKQEASWDARDKRLIEDTGLLKRFVEGYNRTLGGAYSVHHAPFLSYQQVRNDCELELQWGREHWQISEHSAIEMEAYAMFHAAHLLNTRALPVIKAVSDVGVEAQTLMEGMADKDRERIEFNKAQLAELGVDDHREQRRVFRPVAAQRAASAMVAFLCQVLFRQGEWL